MTENTKRIKDSENLAHFAAIPWCARHLKGEHIIAEIPPSRIIKSATQEDGLFAETLNTPKAIEFMLQVYTEPSLQSQTSGQLVDEIKCFLTLGSGLNGHPGVCHGGLVTTILDEVTGLFIPANMKRKLIPRGKIMTAYLNTTFIKPVPTNSTVMARGRLVKVEGRKYLTEGTVEDENGNVLARAEALFVMLKAADEKL
ncbi:thioesterase superfamily protein [Xylariaceae sp. FL0255]|nr:thioesterase superfamily protein [Xylariaceae sp. FL0255]